MDYMVTIEDADGCICGEPEWFVDRAAAVEWGKSSKETSPRMGGGALSSPARARFARINLTPESEMPANFLDRLNTTMWADAPDEMTRNGWVREGQSDFYTKGDVRAKLKVPAGRGYYIAIIQVGR